MKMSKTCEMQCCKLKQAEYKINLMRTFLKSPEYHKVSKNFYTINDELTKIANKLLSIIGEEDGTN
jgi:hypothetical protein